MNIDQLSTQIVAINDAIQILARNGTSVEQHGKEIEGLIQKHGKNEDRIREIEALIHQSCELKTKEITENKEDLHAHIERASEKGVTFTKYVAGSIAAAGLGFFYYTFNVIENQSAEHTSFEIRQEEKADKLFQEIFTVMRGIKSDITEMKSNIAVMNANQKHYQDELANHMKDEEEKWRNIEK